MVIREYLKCSVCECKHLLRVGVGLDNYEVLSFDCNECAIPISVAIRANPPQANLESIENCLFIRQDDSIKNIVNVHPNFAFKKESFHSRTAFPSLEYMNKVSPYMKTIAGKFQDGATQFDVRNAKNIWGIVKNIIVLSSSGKDKKYRKMIGQYLNMRKGYPEEIKADNYAECVLTFMDSLFYPKINWLLEPVEEMVDNLISQKFEEWEKFEKFYSEDMKQDSLNRYMSIFNDYFKCRTELNQMLIHARISDSDTEDRVVGSKNFDEIKFFYGQAYEVLTTQFFVLACINNIKDGRSYDQFKSMTLNKYLKDVEKAKRHNPFSECPKMSKFSEYVDSSIRNGSHHASFWRDGEIIKYRSGGSGSEREISYSHYLYLCNELIIAIAALFSLELKYLTHQG